MEQWPLKSERLQKAHELVQEQLAAGHLIPSASPWNTPIFVIPKKSGKFRAINYQMQAMGALQPGLPTPAMLPEKWHLLILDLKDCFFTIPLHPDDCQRFAFTLPSLNRQAPASRYQWTVLPQGMKNSPTICQLYVDNALRPLRAQWPTTSIYHYMGDILFCQEAPFNERQLSQIAAAMSKHGLQIAPDKVQRTSPYSSFSDGRFQIHKFGHKSSLYTRTLQHLQMHKN